ncbi:T9SS type A sorting domain-containing protein [uncultured Kordia sp.]|uniref:T9SS type A sorting domain-containing protein n=1 Tax=uncultured Kordia sp. TaxID=507699 RepID=UPI002608A587|nr:T9SS type A sorting domain-containing protein [uncultured Kordia sp.]
MKLNLLILKLLLLLNVFLLQAQDEEFDFQQIGDDINGEAINDNFGWSMALSADGNVVVVGAIRHFGNGEQAGHVRVYEKTNATWTQIGNDIDGENSYNFMGNSVAINSDGSIIAVSATGNSDGGQNAGKVKVFGYINGNWTQLGNDILGEGSGDRCGSALGLSQDGQILAIGANYNDGSGPDNGHVRMYQYVNDTWTQVGNDIDGVGNFDSFGRRLSLSSDGGIVAIAAPFNDDNGSNTGHVRVFQYSNDTWTQIGSDLQGENPQDQFGWAVSLNNDGTTLAIGARLNDETGSNAGKVYIYKYINQVWTQLGNNLTGDSAGDLFGYSVSLNDDGTVVAVGVAKADGSDVLESGLVRVYVIENNTWTQIGTDINGEGTDDLFGYVVSLNDDGTFLAISGVSNDENAEDSGHVRLYEFKPVLSVEDILTDNNFVIYPNPASKEIYFDSKEQLAQVAVYSIEGKLLFTQNVQQESSVAISHLKKGVYVLKIQTLQEKIVIRRLIKQ